MYGAGETPEEGGRGRTRGDSGRSVVVDRRLAEETPLRNALLRTARPERLQAVDRAHATESGELGRASTETSREVPASKEKFMKTYDFTLALSVPSLTDEQVERLYERGLDDATFVDRDGVAYADFSKESTSFPRAVLSAIREVERAGLDIRVRRVEPEQLVSVSAIAERLDRTRQNVDQLIGGARGPGNFPPPAHVIGKHKLWRWPEVSRWFAAYEGRDVPDDTSSFIAAVNGVLEAAWQRGQLGAAEQRALAELVRTEELVPAS